MNRAVCLPLALLPLCRSLALLPLCAAQPVLAQSAPANPAAAPTVPAAPAGTPTASPSQAESGSPPATPARSSPPGPYYVEPPGGDSDPVAPQALPHPRIVLEPPLPGEAGGIFEPLPPPPPRHIAPETALWLGARLGWFFPFGSVFARSVPAGNKLLEQRAVPWRNYASSGPMFELDVGARLARNYNVFLLWERAELGGGNGDGGLLGSTGSTSDGDTDYWALGLRASTNADQVGFLSELSVGYRRARSEWDDGTTLELTQGAFEARLGFGADIRVNRKLSLSPMVSFGVGLFGRAERVDGSGAARSLLEGDNATDGHGWATLQFGAHFDLRGGR